MRIIAYRCGPELHPQLTVAAAKHALSIGADYVEIDVRYTAGGMAVISHAADPKQPLLSLEQFLQCGVKNIVFHCKEGVEGVLRLCRQYDIEDSVVIGVECMDHIAEVKAFNPAIPVLAFMPCSGELRETRQAIAKFANAGADYIRLWEHWNVELLMPDVRKSGKEAWVMAYNPEVEPLEYGYTSATALRNWRELGVQGVLVRNPSFAIGALKRG